MDGLLKTVENMGNEEDDFSFKQLFVPLTNKKAITWIIIIGLIVFFFGLFNGFVGDDPAEITENVAIQSIQNLPEFFTGGMFYVEPGVKLSGNFYRPLLSTYFSLIYTVFGANSFMFHFNQLCLYILNVCLVYYLFKHFFNQKIAFVLSLIFLVHPINSESAYYISATQENLFLFFGLLSLWTVTKYRSQKALIIASILLLVSLLFKESGILFFIVIPLYLFLYHRKKTLPFVGYSLISFVMYVILRINAIGVTPTGTNDAAIQNLHLVSRLINIPEIFLFYLKTFLYPMDLAIIYNWVYTSIDVPHFYIPLVIDLFFVFVVIYASYVSRRKSQKHFVMYTFFVVWFFVGMLLNLQILPLDQTVTDQWFYFPIIGLLGMIGVFLLSFKIELNKPHSVAIIVTLISLLAIRTFTRGFDWEDDFTLASHDLTVSPQAYSLEAELSRLYFDNGDYKDAKIHADRSIQMFPYLDSYTDLGNADFYLGDYTGAKEAFLNATKYGDNYVTYENLSAIYINHDNPQEGIYFIKNIALKKFPYDARLWLYLAVLEYNHGSKSNAKSDIVTAYNYDHALPEVVPIYNAMVSNQAVNYTVGK